MKVPVSENTHILTPSATILDRLVLALERADRLIPHSPEQDDAMDDVWELVQEYRLAQ